MQIYLVDDEDNKADSIVRVIETRFPLASIDRFRSYQSGLKALVLKQPDLLLLDMTMPTYDVGPREPGGRERRYAGREIIRQLNRRKIAVPVIVITQYEQFEEDGRTLDLGTLRRELTELFPDNFVEAVHYNASDSRWSIELEALVSREITRRNE